MNVFASKNECFKCGASKDDQSRSHGGGGGGGNTHNGGGNTSQGGGSKSQGGGTRGPGVGNNQIRPGDWECPKCGENVFASKTVCFKCGTPKGKSNPKVDSRDRGGEEIMTLFVPDIPNDARTEDIAEAFERDGGKVLRVVLRPTNGGISAFVRFSTGREADCALHDVKTRGVRIYDVKLLHAEMAKTNTSSVAP